MSFIVNIYGGPGAGKSTTATGVFHLLKLAGYNVEYVHEVAKDMTWEGRHETLKSQPYIFAKQLRNIERVLPKVECVVTDSPLMLSCLYDRMYGENRYPQSFPRFVHDVVQGQDTLNFLLRRVKPYQPVGRNQDEDGAREIDRQLRLMLEMYDIEVGELDGDIHAAQRIAASAIELMEDTRAAAAA